MEDTAVYMIVMLDVDDMDAFFADYVAPLKSHNQKYGVETLVGTPAPEVLEGTYSKSLTVVLKFKSAAVQRSWYTDPAYQPLLKRRFELTNTETSLALVAPEFQPARIGAAE
ncbi:MAG: DUF1330 domain-containing protein [Pseudomonadota bacterium]